MKRYILVLLVVVAALPAFASWQVDNRRLGKPLGIAQYVNPSSATTLATTPTTGVTLPAGVKTIVLTIDDAPIRYFFGSTAPTGTLGLKIDQGSYTVTYDSALIAGFRFINDSTGTATVTVEYFGER